MRPGGMLASISMRSGISGRRARQFRPRPRRTPERWSGGRFGEEAKPRAACLRVWTELETRDRRERSWRRRARPGLPPPRSGKRRRQSRPTRRGTARRARARNPRADAHRRLRKRSRRPGAHSPTGGPSGAGGGARGSSRAWPGNRLPERPGARRVNPSPATARNPRRRQKQPGLSVAAVPRSRLGRRSGRARPPTVGGP